MRLDGITTVEIFKVVGSNIEWHILMQHKINLMLTGLIYRKHYGLLRSSTKYFSVPSYNSA